ncbi:MAG: MFS transporter [Actinomycetota bacterium]|nr:MFS transporter [Actinomycetota bacterium]|tara:strand:- start:46258 stop:47511 length:1254 start_codon:yes stop_codon:yes gene_type:complete
MSGTHQLDSGRGWVVAFAGCAINTWTFGVFYAFATALEQMANEFDAGLSGIAAFFSVTTFLFFAVGIVAGPLADRFGARRLVALGAFLMGGGLWFTAQVESLVTGIVVYGLGVGLGIGCYLVPLSVATGAWFEKHRTVALGINTVGIGLGTLILVPVAEWLIRTAGWRNAFELMGIGSVIVYGVVALACFRPPTPPASVAASILAARQAVRRSEFWRLYFAGFLMSVALFVPFVFLVQYAKEQGIASSTAAFLITSLGLGSVIGRLGLGVLGMRFGVLPLVIMSFGIQPISYAVWLVAGSNYFLLLLFAALLGVGYGGFVALSPVASAGIFGLEGLGGILGVQYTSAGVGALIGPISAGAVIDATGSYTVAIVAAILVSSAATLAVLPLWRLGDGTPSEIVARSFLSQPTVWMVSRR